jgi:large subunit ribosomal protein L29
MKYKTEKIGLSEAKAKLEELTKTYMDQRFNKILGHVENPLERRITRRKIAQLKTILREFELGIRKV